MEHKISGPATRIKTIGRSGEQYVLLGFKVGQGRKG
jgi:hypothetical protein